MSLSPLWKLRLILVGGAACRDNTHGRAAGGWEQDRDPYSVGGRDPGNQGPEQLWMGVQAAGEGPYPLGRADPLLPADSGQGGWWGEGPGSSQLVAPAFRVG